MAAYRRGMTIVACGLTAHRDQLRDQRSVTSTGELYRTLLVINCYLSSISHHFRDIASRSQKPPHPSLSPRIGIR